MTRPKRICITGGAGFIGSKLAAAWLERGAEVTVIDDLSVGRKENLPAQAKLVIADVLDTDRVAQELPGCDIVYHMAARVAIRSSFEFVVQDTKVNVAGTASVLRAAQSANSVKKFVFTSSMAVYADAPLGQLVSETWPTAPLSPYGISKLAAESLTHQLCAQAGIGSVVLRLFNTYGLGQRLSPYVGAVTIFCNRLAKGEAPQIFGDGEQSRDFVHVEDVVQALLLAAQTEVNRETFNVGTGVATTVNQVIEYLQAALQSDIPARHVDAVPGELRSSVADIRKAQEILGYAPQHSFRNSVAAVARQIVAESPAPAALASIGGNR
jgi:UDP-glucose 4-epimerase